MGINEIHAYHTLPSGQYLVVERHFKAHAAHSGLMPLVRGLQFTPIIGRERSVWRYLWRIPLIRQRFVRYSQAYEHQSLTKELALWRRMRGDRGLVQYLWGENDYLFSGRWAHQRGWKVASWFHKTSAELPAFFPNPDVIKRLDLALCVSESQRAYFTQHLPESQVAILPLGVDTDFFTPGADPAAFKRSVLFVGYTLRDWATLRAICDLLRAHDPDLDIQAIGPEKSEPWLSQIPELQVRIGISDEALLSAYRQAALLILPLRDSTASIAISEALACGVPIVTNDVGGVREYLDSRCAFLHPAGDGEGMAESAIRLLDDPGLNRSMRLAARAQAMRFDWRNIQRRLLDLYREHLGITISPSAE